MAAYSSSKPVFMVLREVSRRTEPIGVAQLSRQLGMSLSSTQRALQTLNENGFLRREGRRGRYRIGYVPERLVNALLERYPIRAEGLITVRRLAASSRCCASLHVRLGWYCARIETVEAAQAAAPTKLRHGKVTLMANDTASQVILAYLGPQELTRYRAFAADGGRPVSDAKLAEIRQRGLAHLRAKTSDEMETVAFPLRDPKNQAFASISIEAPPNRDSLIHHPQFAAWQTIVADFERQLQMDERLRADPFAHLDPDTIRFDD